MKKISIEITCDEFYVADSLHELASFIENSDLEYNQIGECVGDHYTAKVSEVGVKSSDDDVVLNARYKDFLMQVLRPCYTASGDSGESMEVEIETSLGYITEVYYDEGNEEARFYIPGKGDLFLSDFDDEECHNIMSALVNDDGEEEEEDKEESKSVFCPVCGKILTDDNKVLEWYECDECGWKGTHTAADDLPLD